MNMFRQGTLSGSILGAIALSLVLTTSIAFAGDYDHVAQVTNDKALVQAMQAHKRVFFIEAGNLTVSKLLNDDVNGLPHQKWEAKTSAGQTLTVVYNSDVGVRVPVQVGEKFAVGGEFIWTNQGGLIHWVHEDVRDKRPDGYVYVDGVIYGEAEGRH